MMCTYIRLHMIIVTTNLIVICNCNIGLDSKGPVNMENIFVEGQHEHNQDEQGVEHGKEEHRFVSKFLQSSCDQSLHRHGLLN